MESHCAAVPREHGASNWEVCARARTLRGCPRALVGKVAPRAWLQAKHLTYSYKRALESDLVALAELGLVVLMEPHGPMQAGLTFTPRQTAPESFARRAGLQPLGFGLRASGAYGTCLAGSSAQMLRVETVTLKPWILKLRKPSAEPCMVFLRLHSRFDETQTQILMQSQLMALTLRLTPAVPVKSNDLMANRTVAKSTRLATR